MVMLGSVMVGQGAPCIEALAAARGVGYTIFNIIERVRISLFCYSFDSGVTEFNSHLTTKFEISFSCSSDTNHASLL